MKRRSGPPTHKHWPGTTRARKLAANWEGPYKVIKVLGKGAYKLAIIMGFEVPRSWNTSNIKKCYI